MSKSVRLALRKRWSSLDALLLSICMPLPVPQLHDSSTGAVLCTSKAADLTVCGPAQLQAWCMLNSCMGDCMLGVWHLLAGLCMQLAFHLPHVEHINNGYETYRPL